MIFTRKKANLIREKKGETMEEQALRFCRKKDLKVSSPPLCFENLDVDETAQILEFSLFSAIFQRASDIHFKPLEDRVLVLMRKNGELLEEFYFSRTLYDPLVRILKDRSSLPSYKSGIPMEGRLKFSYHSKDLFVRVSFFPTVLGEKVVCRILNFKENLLTLEELGMSDPVVREYKQILLNRRGAILICGAAGSGKTTTLYASLLYLMEELEKQTNIATIEDPVEYIISELNQTEVNSAQGLTFSEGLKSLLRQDPNILGVGEIRDRQTAATALEAGLTGHLVLTTMHAQGTHHAVTRLHELGISPSTIRMSVLAVLHQKLVPSLCSSCGGNGCETCRQTGKKGMTGKFELKLMESPDNSLLTVPGE